MRVAIFIDYENIHRAAQRAFGVRQDAHISPFKVGALLAAANERDASGELAVVEVHRGLPSQHRELELNRAARLIEKQWRAESSLVEVRLRPLRYRKDHDGIVRGQEKGIDVQLAASAIRWALKDECDVAVIFSHDSDMSPVVEMLAEVEGSHRIETASWLSGRHRQRIPDHSGVWNHYLTEDHFSAVAMSPVA